MNWDDIIRRPWPSRCLGGAAPGTAQREAMAKDLCYYADLHWPTPPCLGVAMLPSGAHHHGGKAWRSRLPGALGVKQLLVLWAPEGDVPGNVRHFGWLRLARFWCGVRWWKAVARWICSSLLHEDGAGPTFFPLGVGTTCNNLRPIRLSRTRPTTCRVLECMSGWNWVVLVSSHSLSFQRFLREPTRKK